MSSVNSKIANLFTKITVAFLLSATAVAWEVDMSRRQTDFDRITDQNRLPASTPSNVTMPVFNIEQMITSTLPVQDIVIMNTPKGFVPEKVHVRKGGVYKIHLVNVNPEQRNISFIMDEFAESHSTPYAKEKSFELKPQKAGEFSFHCPETSFRGSLIVVDGERKPASN